jgi:hypothetical protein
MNTSIVYIDDVYIHMEKFHYSIRCTKNIKAGRLVLMEHVIAMDNPTQICGSIVANKKLYHGLYPRGFPANVDEIPDVFTDQAISRDMQNIWKIAKSKRDMNSFDFGNEIVLGNVFSKFNHSCNPNIHMDIVDSIGVHGHPDARIYGAWTLRPIKKGEELFIDYVNGSIDAHDVYRDKFGFACDCTDKFKQAAKKRARVQMEICGMFRDREEAFIQKHARKYIDTDEAKTVIANHAKARLGHFDTPHGLVVIRDI